jgi:F-type H+-transporting ATPase subunit alpha
VTNGFLDDIAVESIRKWERDFLAWLRTSRPQALTDVREKKALTDDVKSSLNAAIDAFKPMFKTA